MLKVNFYFTFDRKLSPPMSTYLTYIFTILYNIIPIHLCPVFITPPLLNHANTLAILEYRSIQILLPLSLRPVAVLQILPHIRVPALLWFELATHVTSLAVVSLEGTHTALPVLCEMSNAFILTI